MAYRNGTYIAFHAEGNTNPTASDIRYYRMIKAWHEHDGVEFRFVNSHEKEEAVKDTASKTVILNSLKKRLDNSKNMILILGPTTKDDTDFVPFEIRYAIDECKIPIIVAYTQYGGIVRPQAHKAEWPAALAARIADGSANVFHIPFKRAAIDDAISRFDVNNQPDGPYIHYTREYQEKNFGVKFK